MIYYRNLQTLINMVESFSHDTKMEFSLNKSSTLYTDLRPGINKRGNRWWGKQSTQWIKTPTKTWGLRKQHEQSIRKWEFVYRISKETKEYAENDSQQKKKNLTRAIKGYATSGLMFLIWYHSYRGHSRNLEFSRYRYEHWQRTGCYNLISAQK